MKTMLVREYINRMMLDHHGRGLWHTRPDENYEDTIEDFIENIVDIIGSKDRVSLIKQKLAFSASLEDHTYEVSERDKAIGRKLRLARESLGWTVQKLAITSSLNSQYIRAIESGEPLLSMETLEKLLTALGITSNEVLTF